MNKQLLPIIASFLLLTGCADKNQYEQATLEQMMSDQDIKDYELDPEHMTDCVVDLSSKNMPGIFALDPDRMTAYRNYTKMLTLKGAEDPQKALEDLRKDFGSAKALGEAHNNYTESILNCLSALSIETEEDELEAEEEKTAESK